MRKKIFLVNILLVIMLITITFATAIKTTNTDKKESPLYQIRIRQAVKEKIRDIVTEFFGERAYFLPFQLFRNTDDPSSRQIITEKEMRTFYQCLISVNIHTCAFPTGCIPTSKPYCSTYWPEC